jgi:hypothetical protein
LPRALETEIEGDASESRHEKPDAYDPGNEDASWLKELRLAAVRTSLAHFSPSPYLKSIVVREQLSSR